MSSPEPGIADVTTHAHARYFANLIFLSYRYSQGGIGAQNRILLFLEERFHPTLLSVDEVHSEEVRALTRKMVGGYFLNETSHPATAVPWDHASPAEFRKSALLVENELADLFGRFQDRRRIRHFSADPVGLAQSLLLMDADYLRRDDGRAGSSEALRTRVGAYSRDPYDSVFLRHGILAVSTKTPEYDYLFSAISQPVVLQHLDGSARRDLGLVLEVFQKRHLRLRDRRLLRLAHYLEDS
jgi:hypothetical protein